ncbi:MAG: amidase [Burkholderiaceae bacterium]|nr:amidase [Burkholderiaceae bacterium]
MADELAWLGLADAGRAIRERRLSSTELVGALLERIARLDQRLHAFLRVDAEQSLRAARLADDEIAQGRWRGPLHGQPIAIKDIIDIEGQVTTCHSRIPGAAAARDATVIGQLRQAGAIFIGKNALHEFATGGPAFDLPWPPARNPWNTALHPGGSSSGSAAAVAAGMVAAALGTDTGGSVRNPATCCALVGLKPGYDLISREGVFPLSYSLDHVGLLTRSAEDCAVLLDATVAPSRRTLNYHDALRADAPLGLRGLRIGLVAHFHEEDAQADEAVTRGIEDAAQALRQLGATVEPVRLPPLGEWVACGRVLQQAEQYAVHEHWLRERPQDYCALSREKLLPGASLSAVALVRAMQARIALCEQFHQVMREHDALLTVSGMTLPCAIDDAQAVARTYTRHARMPFNLTGTPALALPVGFTPQGLPLGVQLAARADGERMLLRIAAAYEAQTQWGSRRPPL